MWRKHCLIGFNFYELQRAQYTQYINGYTCISDWNLMCYFIIIIMFTCIWKIFFPEIDITVWRANVCYFVLNRWIMINPEKKRKKKVHCNVNLFPLKVKTMQLCRLWLLKMISSPYCARWRICLRFFVLFHVRHHKI